MKRIVLAGLALSPSLSAYAQSSAHDAQITVSDAATCSSSQSCYTSIYRPQVVSTSSAYNVRVIQ